MVDLSGLVFRINDHGQGPEIVRQVISLTTDTILRTAFSSLGLSNLIYFQDSGKAFDLLVKTTWHSVINVDSTETDLYVYVIWF